MPGTTPAVNDFLQIRVNCQAASQLSQNVLHYKVTSTAGGGLTLAQIGTQFVATVGAQYRAWMPATATFNGVTVQNLTPPKTDPRETVGGGAGTAVGNLAPRQASGLIRTNTGLGGRANRGRIYIGFMSADSIDADGELTAGGLATLFGLANLLGPTVVLTIGALGVVLQLVVRHPDTPGPIIVPVSTDVTAMQAQQLIATQRRRGDYGRQNF